MKRWYNEFNRGRHPLTDEFRKGRQKSVVGPENINAVQKPAYIKPIHENACKSV